MRDAELLVRDPELRDPLDERLEPFDELRELLLRELLDDERRRELDRDLPLRRSAAGISSLATAFASCGICFSRNFAMRSSSRRMPRASLAVSLSFTASASASMPCRCAISSNSLWYSVFAFFSIFSASPVPRIACSGPCAAALALLATDVSRGRRVDHGVGPELTGPASALPPSC